MTNRARRFSWMAAALLSLVLAGPAPAQDLTGRDILDQVEKLLWGQTMQGSFEMSVTTPRWQRTLELRVWMDRPERSFIRILSPAKEAGIGSLRIKSEMWNYLPSIERTIKIPPSMMLQPWMGSDFTNDDLVKESSVVDDYSHRILGIEQADGAPVYRIEAIPKPEAAVVWGKLVYRVRKADFVPLGTEYYSERGELVRTMVYGNVRPIGGRTIPTRWEMRPTNRPGNLTVILLKDAQFDGPIDSEVFSLRNLQKQP